MGQVVIFDDNGVGLYLHHCPQSPEINPIEWVWGYFKGQLAYLKPFAKTKEELSDAFMKFWSELSDEDRHKIVNTMPKRIIKIHKRNGQWTKY